MFCNDDKLAERLTKAGEATGELVWRMPLRPEYDKLIDSKFADMKNTGGRFGGAITAAQFIQRFVDDKTPWAHLDIAGTGFDLRLERHQQELGLGLGRAAARSAGGGSLRDADGAHDRNPVLPPARPAARRHAADACWKNRWSAAGVSSCRALPKSASKRSTRICGPIATTASCRTAPGASRKRPQQPILLTLNESNPNAANVRFLIDGAPMPADAEAYERIVLLFDGDDEDAVAAARSEWSDAKAEGASTPPIGSPTRRALGQEGLSAVARFPRWVSFCACRPNAAARHPVSITEGCLISISDMGQGAVAGE